MIVCVCEIFSVKYEKAKGSICEDIETQGTYVYLVGVRHIIRNGKMLSRVSMDSLRRETVFLLLSQICDHT